MSPDEIVTTITVRMTLVRDGRDAMVKTGTVTERATIDEAPHASAKRLADAMAQVQHDTEMAFISELLR